MIKNILWIKYGVSFASDCDICNFVAPVNNIKVLFEYEHVILPFKSNKCDKVYTNHIFLPVVCHIIVRWCLHIGFNTLLCRSDWWGCNNYHHIFMPPPLGAGGIMFSGCPSVRPKPEIPSFDMYMGPLVHPTNCNRFTACPSVRPSVRPSVCPSVRPSGKVSGHLPENAWREWPEILHADVY